jgi:NAD(P)-dependent dehydrogenase (short-subunit alcohol dehydrogenase family)
MTKWGERLMDGYLDRFDMKTAVVTGGGSGLGRALSVRLGGEGWKVGIADIDMKGAEESLALVEKAGGSGELFRCDVREPAVFEVMAGRFFEEWGGVGMLVNNAGVAAGGIVGEIPIEDWKKVMDTNVWGVINGCHAFVPRMKAQGGGHVLNVSSSAGIVCLPEMAPYNTAKAAVIALSETLRSEVAPHGIGVTVACPTFFNTALLEEMTYTDDFQIQFAQAAFANAKMSAEEVALRILKAVGRNRLYVFPQFAAKWTRISKRLSPSAHHRALTFMCTSGRARSVANRMARRGLV